MKKDCFAYNAKNGMCTALTVCACEGCTFYKTSAEAKASREELTDYLKSYGIESGVAALMLPQVIDLEISVDCSYDDETGLVAIDPVGLRIGESDFSLAAFPAETFSAINNGLNKLLMASGYRLESIRFTEDGIILE